jgi:membrane protein implicated in regulation of membrane protease activity
MLLPLLLPAVPGIVAFVVLPALVLIAVATAPAIVAGAVVVPTYLLARAVRRRPHHHQQAGQHHDHRAFAARVLVFDRPGGECDLARSRLDDADRRGVVGCHGELAPSCGE